MKRNLLLILLCLCLLTPHSVSAEDCFTINVDLLDMDSLRSDDYVARTLSASTQGVRVRKYISSGSEAAAPVRLTLTEMNNRTLLFDKDYGYQSGTFDSGVIYLPYLGDGTTPYLITLYVGDFVYAMPFMHLQARLSHNGACTHGVRLRDLSAALGGDWLMGTLLDLQALRASGRQRIDLCASNQYIIGTADVTLSGDSLSVSVSFASGANVDLHSAAVYVVTDLPAFAAGSYPSARGLGDWVDVSGADAALLYLPMEISYDPSGLSSFWYDLGALQSQLDLWNAHRGASSAPSQGDSSWSGNWGNDGWSDGWDNGSGWDDEWVEGGGW